MSSLTRPRRLLVLQTHPIQYYAPLYRALDGTPGLSCEVIYLADPGARGAIDPGFGRPVTWDVPLRDGYRSTVLRPEFELAGSSFLGRDAPRLERALAAARPDWLLVHGYASRMNWRAVAWARRNGVRVAYSSDTNDRLQPRGLRWQAKRLVLRRFFGRVDLCLSPGEANRAYLEALGVPADRIAWVPFAVDAGRFQPADTPRPNGPPRFIWAGKVYPGKRPLDFVAALAALHAAGIPAQGVMAGEGASDAELQAAVSSMPAGILRLEGFVNQAAMPQLLRSGDAFVFTSEVDQYGVGVVEAAACGLALVVADVNGCVGRDAAARPGENALVYHPGDQAALVAHLTALATDPALLARLRAASARIGRAHGADRAAAAIAAALVALCGGPR